MICYYNFLEWHIYKPTDFWHDCTTKPIKLLQPQLIEMSSSSVISYVTNLSPPCQKVTYNLRVLGH